MPFSKGDPNINRNGRPKDIKSMRAIFREKLTTKRRERIADKFIEEAEAGSIAHYQAIFTALGEAHEPAAANVNILAFIQQRPELRNVAQRLFAALPLGTGDAGGMGSLRQPEWGDVEARVDALAPPDADQ